MPTGAWGAQSWSNGIGGLFCMPHPQSLCTPVSHRLYILLPNGHGVRFGPGRMQPPTWLHGFASALGAREVAQVHKWAGDSILECCTGRCEACSRPRPWRACADDPPSDHGCGTHSFGGGTSNTNHTYRQFGTDLVLTPVQLVEGLDSYIVGQDDAKRVSSHQMAVLLLPAGCNRCCKVTLCIKCTRVILVFIRCEESFLCSSSAICSKITEVHNLGCSQLISHDAHTILTPSILVMNCTVEVQHPGLQTPSFFVTSCTVGVQHPGSTSKQVALPIVKRTCCRNLLGQLPSGMILK